MRQWFLVAALCCSELCDGFVFSSPHSYIRSVGLFFSAVAPAPTPQSTPVPPQVNLPQGKDADDLFGSGSGWMGTPPEARGSAVPRGVEGSGGGSGQGGQGSALLSLSPAEFVELVGGSGRAKMAWSALRDGIDPSQERFSEDCELVTTEAQAASSSSALGTQMRRLQHGPTLGKATRELLAERLAGLPPVVHSVASVDGTRKLLVRLHDGLEVECVLIPMTGSVEHRVRQQGHGWQADEEPGEVAKEEQQQRGERRGWKEEKKKPRMRGNRAAIGHTTLCVSSQVGCARGCAFCATGAMGLVRCLSAEEILAQCFHGRRVARECGLPPLNNVVFMGMGEPLNNPIAVGAAVERLTHDALGFGFSKTRVTVSTVAPSPEAILRHAAWYSRSGGGDDDNDDDDDGRTTDGTNERASSDQREEEDKGCLANAMLAWSVHAADDTTRKLLVPTTRHSMVELREAFRAALLSRPSKALRTLMIEVALMDGLNDSREHAEGLADFLGPLLTDEGVKVCVNLIPYNPVAHQPLFRRATPSAVSAFQRTLRDKGIFTFVRTTHGDEEAAACGQLATASPKGRSPKMKSRGGGI